MAITGPVARRCRAPRRVITTVSHVLAVSHATSGAALGLAVAGFAPRVADVHPSPGSVLTFAAVCAGAALLPDLDHPSSTATRRFSVFSWLACHAVRPLSAVIFDLTRGRRDHGKGTHRGLTHTAVGAVLLGLAVNLASAAWGEPVLLATLFVVHRAGDQGSGRARARPAVAGDRGRPHLCGAGVGARRHGRDGGLAGHRGHARHGGALGRGRGDRERRPAACGRCRSGGGPGTRSAARG